MVTHKSANYSNDKHEICKRKISEKFHIVQRKNNILILYDEMLEREREREREGENTYEKILDTHENMTFCCKFIYQYDHRSSHSICL